MSIANCLDAAVRGGVMTKQEADIILGRLDELSDAGMSDAVVRQLLISELDLDMSPNARRMRAREMGFDTSKVWHHGSDALPFNAFEFGHEGASADIGRPSLSSRAIYLADSKKHAGRFGGTVESFYVRGKTLEADASDGFAEWAKELGFDNPQRAIKEYYEGAIYTALDLDDKFAALTRQAKAEGYDNVRVSLGGLRGDDIDGSVLIVLDPKNIRSINAAFDPAHSDSPNLMFAMAGSQPEVDQLARLTDRISSLGRTAGAQVPDLDARITAALNLLSTAQEAAADRGLTVDGDTPANVVDLAQANSTRVLSQIVDLLGQERTLAIADDVATLAKDMPTDPQAIAQRLNDILDQYFPEEQKQPAAANDNQDLGPVSPVEMELHTIDRMGAIMELIGVCRG